jgi:hypothetical protein
MDVTGLSRGDGWEGEGECWGKWDEKGRGCFDGEENAL